MGRIGVLVLVLGCHALADEPRKIKVAMLAPRAEAGVAEGTARLIGELIVADATRSNRYAVITPSDVTAVLTVDRQRQLLGCEEESCAAEISNALGADLLLDLSVGAVGTLRVIVLRLIDARTAQAVRRETESAGDESGLVDAAHRISARLFGLEPVSRPRRSINPGLFVLGGAGALGVGGLVVGLLANSDYQSFKVDPFNDSLGNSARLKANVADGLYAGALLAAGISVVLLLTHTAEPGTGGN